MRSPLLLLAAMTLLLTACASRTRVADEPIPANEAVVSEEAAPALTGPTATDAPAAPTTFAEPVAPALPGELGTSNANRLISANTYGEGEIRVYLIASIHGDETEGRSALEAIRTRLASETHGATVRLVDDMNPDGSAQRSRTNGSGVDLNRNWPAANFRKAKSHGASPLSEPETAAVHADITRFDPHFIIVLHSARGGPFVNYDGPAITEVLAERFSAGARSAGDSRWRTVPDMGYPTPGSMGSYFGKDRGLPILTVELRRGDALEKIPGPLTEGLAAVLADRSVALRPLSLATPSVRVASTGAAEQATAAPAQ